VKPTLSAIPVVVGRRLRQGRTDVAASQRRQRYLRSVLPSVKRSVKDIETVDSDIVPSIYILNAAALSKPHAVQQLTADLISYDTIVAVITETHLKQKHTAGVVDVPDYVVWRRDRKRRRGGGVAVYVKTSVQSTLWTYSGDDETYELLWVRVGGNVIGALYHPPKPRYDTSSLLDYLDACIHELTQHLPSASIILAGDFNQISDSDVLERTGLTQLVKQPKRGANTLDRMFVSCPATYSTVRVVTSSVRSDHKAIVSYGIRPTTMHKTTVRKPYRRVTPTQHASFLQYVSSPTFKMPELTDDTQQSFDWFYDAVLELLNMFYPVQYVTVTSRDPEFITPQIKAMLRRKNRLMRAGREEEAGAVHSKLGKS